MHFKNYKLCCKKNPSIADALAFSSRAIKIHYLVRGRNAWNSTWVQHYYPGCMANANSNAGTAIRQAMDEEKFKGAYVTTVTLRRNLATKHGVA